MTAYQYLPSLDYLLNTIYVLNSVRDEYEKGLADSADLEYYYDRVDEAEEEHYNELGFEDNPFWSTKFSPIRG